MSTSQLAKLEALAEQLEDKLQVGRLVIETDAKGRWPKIPTAKAGQIIVMQSHDGSWPSDQYMRRLSQLTRSKICMARTCFGVGDWAHAHPLFGSWGKYLLPASTPVPPDTRALKHAQASGQQLPLDPSRLT